MQTPPDQFLVDMVKASKHLPNIHWERTAACKVVDMIFASHGHGGGLQWSALSLS